MACFSLSPSPSTCLSSPHISFDLGFLWSPESLLPDHLPWFEDTGTLVCSLLLSSFVSFLLGRRQFYFFYCHPSRIFRNKDREMRLFHLPCLTGIPKTSLLTVMCRALPQTSSCLPVRPLGSHSSSLLPEISAIRTFLRFFVVPALVYLGASFTRAGLLFCSPPLYLFNRHHPPDPG